MECFVFSNAADAVDAVSEADKVVTGCAQFFDGPLARMPHDQSHKPRTNTLTNLSNMIDGTNWTIVLFFGVPVMAIILWYLLRGLIKGGDSK